MEFQVVQIIAKLQTSIMIWIIKVTVPCEPVYRVENVKLFIFTFLW